MRIAIFGVGGVGGYFGGRLAQAGENVIFVARGAQLHAMLNHGLRVESLKGDFVISPVQVCADPAEIGPVDAILVGVKAWQVSEAANAMQPMIGADTFVAPLQNGVDAPDQLAEALGIEHVIGGLCQISAHVATPGVIRHVGVEPYVAFGELNGQPSARVERLAHSFQRAQGVRVEISADIRAAIWRKFLFIAAISGVGAVCRAPVGIFRNLPETRQLLVEAMTEIYQIAQARRIKLPSDIVEQTLGFIDSLAPGVLASMQRDIMDGKPSELEAQNGAVVRMGAELGMPTPVHAYLYASLIPQERRARRQLEF
jgi:2-dehydropantoate 2-reductase